MAKKSNESDYDEDAVEAVIVDYQTLPLLNNRR
jgi:hypothetical protein